MAGKLFDDRGNRMRPSWARKGLWSVARIPAAEIERRVVEALRKIEPRLGSGARSVDDDQAEKSPPSTDRGELTCDRRAQIRALIDRVAVERTMIRIALSERAAGEGQANTLD